MVSLGELKQTAGKVDENSKKIKVVSDAVQGNILTYTTNIFIFLL